MKFGLSHKTSDFDYDDIYSSLNGGNPSANASLSTGDNFFIDIEEANTQVPHHRSHSEIISLTDSKPVDDLGYCYPNNDRPIEYESESQVIYPANAVAFAKFINISLHNDGVLNHLLPLDPNLGDIFEKSRDGIIFLKLIQLVDYQAFSDKLINKGRALDTMKRLENLKRALSAAERIGCNVSKIDLDDLLAGR
jgi:hypothetical protein